MNIELECKKILSDVMEIDEDTINNDSSPANIENWDSLSHVNLVMALEKKFKIKISPEEGIENIEKFDQIVNFISSKIQIN